MFWVNFRTNAKCKLETAKWVWKFDAHNICLNSRMSLYFLKMSINKCTNDVSITDLKILEMQVDWFGSNWFSNLKHDDVNVFDLRNVYTCKHQIRVCCWVSFSTIWWTSFVKELIGSIQHQNLSTQTAIVNLDQTQNDVFDY